MPQTPEELDTEIKAHIADLESRLAQLKARERQRRFRAIIEPTLGCLTYLAFAAIPIILLIAFIKSIGWIVEVALPVLTWISGMGLLLVPVFLLLAIPRVSRGWAGLGITVSSYALGLALWTWCLVVAYAVAGIFWMVIGLMLAGVGVVAVAAIASAIQGEWFVFFQIVVGVIVVYILRMLGAYLIDRTLGNPDRFYLAVPFHFLEFLSRGASCSLTHPTLMDTPVTAGFTVQTVTVQPVTVARER